MTLNKSGCSNLDNCQDDKYFVVININPSLFQEIIQCLIQKLYTHIATAFSFLQLDLVY